MCRLPPRNFPRPCLERAGRKHELPSSVALRDTSICVRRHSVWCQGGHRYQKKGTIVGKPHPLRTEQCSATRLHRLSPFFRSGKIEANPTMTGRSLQESKNKQTSDILSKAWLAHRLHATTGNKRRPMPCRSFPGGGIDATPRHMPPPPRAGRYNLNITRRLRQLPGLPVQAGQTNKNTCIWYKNKNNTRRGRGLNGRARGPAHAET